ncbi:hypothetical protein CHU92_14255 [Flavobacterium cyanobacteriorum]|uniref:Uncharacterized protein n=1 Tax=Flavobacterium cyanobacteriorum TaxID=2022802 RepID=A0A255YSM9_9FLAO|nr:hypothetical protein [Flavobacterium cyanobacteriorum]OYQ32246.1 hypothetical protein CHU92_14255 [Flavobacterium cyanobacteriorum]
MELKWKQENDTAYSLSTDGLLLATLEWHITKGTATGTVDGKHYKIYRKGFWKTAIIIQNHEGAIEIKPVNWYGHKWYFNYEGKNYTLSVSNNPMAGWSITHNGQVILAYNLDSENSKATLRIDGNSTNGLLHCLLLYMMLPILSENSADFTGLMFIVTANADANGLTLH